MGWVSIISDRFVFSGFDLLLIWSDHSICRFVLHGHARKEGTCSGASQPASRWEKKYVARYTQPHLRRQRLEVPGGSELREEEKLEEEEESKEEEEEEGEEGGEGEMLIEDEAATK